jgi:hypothetical protein
MRQCRLTSAALNRISGVGDVEAHPNRRDIPEDRTAVQ